MTSATSLIGYRFGHFQLNPDERQLLADGVALRVGAHAFDLLVALAQRSGHLVSPDELRTLVWPRAVVEANTLQVHISSLRKILGAEAIANVSGRGYRLTLAVSRTAHGAPVPARPNHNLPYQLTSFIGRENQIVEIEQLLRKTRLLTLTGAGGCGKTRLAIEIAGRVEPQCEGGAWIVELAAIADGQLVPQAIANALGLKEQPDKALSQTIADYIAQRHLLIVLDNAEHILAACAALADLLLRRCASLAILVTSRERLGIDGELTYRVPSLSVPDALQDPRSTEALACESARLFIERARMQRPDFEITPKEAGALASICRRLDGIALAIELAAPRVRSMSLEELSGHLDDRFGVLIGGSRTALPRHRTLRSLIDWSYDLLGDSEKTMLCRASVFAGGWTLEAAERVCGGESVQRSEVLDLMTSLVDKNLVVTETDGAVTRFSMLETVRHYARDRLQKSGEEATMRARHLDCFLAMAEAAERQYRGADWAASLERLESDRDNLRAALSWSLSAGADTPAGLRLAGMLAFFWWQRGYIREGRGWLSRLLATAPRGEGAAARAKACHGAGILAEQEDDYPAARVLAEEALAIREQLGDRPGIGRILSNLGSVARRQGDYGTARTRFEEALTICRETDDRHSAASVLINLGDLATDQGDFGPARAFLEESLAIWRATGGGGTASALVMLGRLAHAQGDYPGAQAMLEESLALARKEKHPPYMFNALTNLGSVARSRGAHGAAMVLLKEALIVQRETGERVGMFECLEAFAAVALALGRPRFAARIWGGAEKLRDEIKAPMTSFGRARYDREVSAVRIALGDDAAFDLARQEGRAMSMDQVVNDALAFDPEA